MCYAKLVSVKISKVAPLDSNRENRNAEKRAQASVFFPKYSSIIKLNINISFFIGPSDDTDLCFRIIKAGYRLGLGTPIIYQVHRNNFLDFKKK